MTDTNKAKIELKPCPFCGTYNEPKKRKKLRVMHIGYSDYAVRCFNLECQATGSMTSRNKAIKAWNTRAGETK